MKPLQPLISCLAVGCLISPVGAAISQWEAASQAIATNVTTSTNAGAGWTFSGGDVVYDYGDLSNGSITSAGPGASIEFIFNL